MLTYDRMQETAKRMFGCYPKNATTQEQTPATVVNVRLRIDFEKDPETGEIFLVPKYGDNP